MAWRKVTIQEPIRQDNSFGEQENNSTETVDVWAELTPLSSNERIRGMQQGVAITHKVRVRYGTEINPTSRLVIHDASGDRFLNIIGSPINENEENAWLLFMCSEGK